jgi:hypothetical protein
MSQDITERSSSFHVSKSYGVPIDKIRSKNGKIERKKKRNEKRKLEKISEPKMKWF